MKAAASTIPLAVAIILSSVTAGAAEDTRGQPEVYTQWPFDAAQAKRRQQETAQALGTEVEHEVALERGVKMILALIPAGEFLMGSAESPEELANRYRRFMAKPGTCENEKPHHRVRIAEPFWIGKHEVTQAQWKTVMGANPSFFDGRGQPGSSGHDQASHHGEAVPRR